MDINKFEPYQYAKQMVLEYCSGQVKLATYFVAVTTFSDLLREPYTRLKSP